MSCTAVILAQSLSDDVKSVKILDSLYLIFYILQRVT